MNRTTLARRRARVAYNAFRTGRPGIDNFNLGAALDQIAGTSQTLSNSITSTIDKINQVGNTIGASATSVVNKIVPPSTATPSSPAVTYLSNVKTTVMDNKLTIVIVAAVVGIVLLVFLRK